MSVGKYVQWVIGVVMLMGILALGSVLLVGANQRVLMAKQSTPHQSR
jgi:hypothetical protein